jgi:hypothetical protein
MLRLNDSNILSLKESNIVSSADSGNVSNRALLSATASRSYSTFADIFKSIDSVYLWSAISNNDEASVQEIITETNHKIAALFFEKHQINLNEEFSDNPDGITLVGLFYAAKEELLVNEFTGNLNQGKATHSTNSLKAAPEFDCFLTAVSTFIGITQARSIWNAIVSGASEQTVISIIKLVGRRVATVIGVGIMVYDVGGCLDWW